MTISKTTELGWIGLGDMGLAMASNLQKHLHSQGQSPLRIWNRTTSKGENITSLGGIRCDTIESLIADCDIIFISLNNDESLQIVIADIIRTPNLTNKIFVDTTTVHPDTSKDVSAKLKRQKASLVSAPVFGSAPMASERKVLIAAAGEADSIRKISPFIKGVLARDILEVDERPEKASLLKIIGNFLVSGMTEIVGEAHVLAEKSEMGHAIVEKLLEAQFGPLPTMISRRLTQGVYMPPKGVSPWSNLDLALKDTGHAIDCAEAAGTRLRVGEVIQDHQRRAKAYSQEQNRQLDSAALYGIIRCDAGLDFESDFVRHRDS